MYPEVFFGEKNRDSASLKMNNGTPGYTLARSGGITVALYALAATKKYTVDQLIQIARRVLSGTPCACQKRFVLGKTYCEPPLPQQSSVNSTPKPSPRQSSGRGLDLL